MAAAKRAGDRARKTSGKPGGRSKSGRKQGQGIRLSAEKRQAILDLHAEGLSRNAIAKRVPCAESTVTRVCDAEGLSFDRTATSVAVAARQMDLAAMRAEAETRLWEDSMRLADQMWAPHTYVDHGGKEYVEVRWEMPEPVIADKRSLMAARTSAITTALKIRESAESAGTGAARSVLGALASALGAIPDTETLDECDL